MVTRNTKTVSLISVASGRNIIGETAASTAATSPTALPATRRPRSPTSATVPVPIMLSPIRWASTLRRPARANSDTTNGCNGGYSAVGTTRWNFTRSNGRMYPRPSARWFARR